LRTCPEFQVLWPVVVADAIAVVDSLGLVEFSAEQFFHDAAVFWHSDAVSGYDAVAVLVEEALPFAWREATWITMVDPPLVVHAAALLQLVVATALILAA